MASIPIRPGDPLPPVPESGDEATIVLPNEDYRVRENGDRSINEDDVMAPQDVAPDATPSGLRGASFFGRTMIILGATFLAVSLIREFASIIAPTFLALNLLITVYPMYRWMARHGLPKLFAAVVAGVVVFVVLILFFWSIVWSLTGMVNGLFRYQDRFQELYTESLTYLKQYGLDEGAMLERLSSVLSPSNIINVVSSLGSSASGVVGVLALVILVLAFLAVDFPNMSNRHEIVMKLHPAIGVSVMSVMSGVRRYWLVTTIFGLIVAALDYFLLLWLEIPMPLEWAVLAFVTNYIPNVGFVIGVIPPMALGLMEHGPLNALIVLVAYSVINFLVQTVIQPKFTGDAVGVSPTVSVLSLLVWTVVLGPLGALLALPATLVVKAMLIDSDPRARWANAILSARPEDPDDVPTKAERLAAE